VKQRKAVLISENFTPIVDDVHNVEFSYESHIRLGDEVLILTCDFSQYRFMRSYNIRMDLLYNRNGENHRALVISSHADAENGRVTLKLIEVPQELRHSGLGTQIFICWLRVLEHVAKLFQIYFSEIWGNIADGSGFDSQISCKLYKKFHRYVCFGDKRLILNFKKLRNSYLEYAIQ